ncbi:unnamed protein product [Sphagnum balticum]
MLWVSLEGCVSGNATFLKKCCRFGLCWSQSGSDSTVKFLLPGKVETVVFQMLTPPSIDAVRTALKSLEDLNALDKAKALTPLGLHLARMPVDAQVGKLLIFACILKYLDPILTIAASQSARSPFVSPMEAAGAWLKFAGNSKRDHMVVVVAYNGWLNAKQDGWDAESNYLSGNFLLREVQILADLGFVPGFEDREHGKSQSVEDSLRTNANSVRVVKALICAVFYPNISQSWTEPLRFLLRKELTITDVVELRRIILLKSRYVVPHPTSRATNPFAFLCYHTHEEQNERCRKQAPIARC